MLRSARRISSLRCAVSNNRGTLSLSQAVGEHKIWSVAEFGRVFTNFDADEGFSRSCKNLREGVVPSALQASSIAFDKLLILKSDYYN